MGLKTFPNIYWTKQKRVREIIGEALEQSQLLNTNSREVNWDIYFSSFGFY